MRLFIPNQSHITHLTNQSQLVFQPESASTGITLNSSSFDPQNLLRCKRGYVTNISRIFVSIQTVDFPTETRFFHKLYLWFAQEENSFDLFRLCDSAVLSERASVNQAQAVFIFAQQPYWTIPDSVAVSPVSRNTISHLRFELQGCRPYPFFRYHVTNPKNDSCIFFAFGLSFTKLELQGLFLFKGWLLSLFILHSTPLLRTIVRTMFRLDRSAISLLTLEIPAYIVYHMLTLLLMTAAFFISCVFSRRWADKRSDNGVFSR